ncbi:putative vomeronasal receptor-like protein 4 [Thomomys bottae]
MMWSNIIQRIIYLSFTGPGIVGNILVFVRHVYTFVTGPERKPIDLILIHLTFSNAVIICSTGVRDIPMLFYLRIFLNDVGCKLVLYVERVARGLSICTTCLLSTFQAITISPRTAHWRKLKPRTAWQVLPYLLLFWVLNSLISSNLLRYITATKSMNGSGHVMYFGYCYMLPSMQIVRWLFLLLMALRDVFFQSLMGWSSGYMAFYLYKHHKRMFYLHSSRFASHSRPEIRATRSTLVLMAGFLVFYWADFILSFYVGSMMTFDSTIIIIKIVVVLAYASLSPFVLVIRDLHGIMAVASGYMVFLFHKHHQRVLYLHNSKLHYEKKKFLLWSTHKTEEEEM